MIRRPVRPTFLIVYSLVIVGISVCQASANYVLSFTDDNTSASFNVPVMQSVWIPVYLLQTGAGVANGNLATDGVIAVGVRIEFDTDATSATIASATPDAAFPNFPLVETGVGFAQFQGSIPLGGTAVTGAAIRLGSFTFEGNSVSDVTNINFAMPNFTTLGASSNQIVGGGTAGLMSTHFPVLDSDVFSAPSLGTMLMTTAIPEPSSFLFLGIAALIPYLRSRFYQIA